MKLWRNLRKSCYNVRSYCFFRHGKRVDDLFESLRIISGETPPSPLQVEDSTSPDTYYFTDTHFNRVPCRRSNEYHQRTTCLAANGGNLYRVSIDNGKKKPAWPSTRLNLSKKTQVLIIMWLGIQGVPRGFAYNFDMSWDDEDNQIMFFSTRHDTRNMITYLYLN